jgi:hypothetical protein
MSGWGCPHDQNGICAKVEGRPCDPGMKGCELAGRYRFADESKNARFYEIKARENASADERDPPASTSD